jgi:branched-chain amino acid transport system ATP-binding protein
VRGAENGRENLLEVDDIHTYYGTIHALKGISIEVKRGEIVTLIGSNGAGKSTTLRSINGLNHPREGTIRFQGTNITDTAPHDVVKMGISQSPEGRRVFPRMSVMENLEMGAYQRADRAAIGEDVDRVFALFPRLAERKSQKAGTMSGGEQQMLAIGRALMADPKLLLLDEPSMGLAPILVEREVRVLLDEQDRRALLVDLGDRLVDALEVSNRAYVLETGYVTLSDESGNLRENPEVQAAYLGAA